MPVTKRCQEKVQIESHPRIPPIALMPFLRNQCNLWVFLMNKIDRTPNRSTPYPFSAIVGQDEMKLALILNAVDPLIGGVLIMGHRGTGKSTAVRALATLLPEIPVVPGCIYNCEPSDSYDLCDNCLAILETQKLKRELKPVPIVELPLGATEDRVCGTIDIERAISHGRKTFDPGLLARANRGFLYIDEVNLLEDHLIDILLDVAVTGRNKVEREGVSVEHPAKFVLVGSGNPEEGDLRPQLLDRFGLHVEVLTEGYLVHRVTIVERREAYDRSRESFCKSFDYEQEKLRKQIIKGRSILDKVNVDRLILTKIAQLCADLKVDGHRGELTIMRAAKALAAFENRRYVTEEDVRSVAVMALRHRLRRDALEETATTDQIQQAVDEALPESKPQPQSKKRPAEAGDTDREPTRTDRRGGGQGRSSAGKGGARANTTEEPSGAAVEQKERKSRLDKELNALGRTASKAKFHSRRSLGTRSSTEHSRGRYARAVARKTAGARIAIDATIRALVAFNTSRDDTSVLRYKLLKQKQGTLFVFAIDTSGSMAANRIALAKSTILKLLRRSYLNRDSVAIISFHGTKSEVELPPSRSILRARRVLDSLSMGGSTPLSTGLATTIKLIKRVGDKFGRTAVLLFTDGRSNVLLRPHSNPGLTRQQKIELELRDLNVSLMKTRAVTIVVDTQRQFESSEETRALAQTLNARFVKLSLP
jgi:magnesium chelatase subunit D